jgi:NAD(P)-dependent dehydrogenase (short-subunit alcohol dehydrogenase family)
MTDTRLIYSSSNGDRWLLVGDESRLPLVRHEPNRSSGGEATEIELADFMSRDGNSPQGEALRQLLETLRLPSAGEEPLPGVAGSPFVNTGIQGAFIVTGAAGNLGAAVALELARNGVPIVCLDRSKDKLDRLTGQLPAKTEILSIAGTDMTSQDACAAAVAQAAERFGSVIGLANTVGGFQAGPVTKALELWDAMLTANARTALAISAAVLPIMQSARYGRIVHVAAMAGLKAPAGLAAYAASKAALIRLTESIAEEYRGDNISANCVLPSVIDTPQNREAMPKADTSSWTSPEAIARLIVFLLSPAGGVVSGAAIPASGPVGPSQP